MILLAQKLIPHVNKTYSCAIAYYLIWYIASDLITSLPIYFVIHMLYMYMLYVICYTYVYVIQSILIFKYKRILQCNVPSGVSLYKMSYLKTYSLSFLTPLWKNTIRRIMTQLMTNWTFTTVHGHTRYLSEVLYS